MFAGCSQDIGDHGHLAMDTHAWRLGSFSTGFTGGGDIYIWRRDSNGGQFTSGILYDSMYRQVKSLLK